MPASKMVRALTIAKQTAIKARTQAVNALKGLIVMAPDPIREQLRHLKTPALVRTCCAYRVDRAADPTSAIKLSLRSSLAGTSHTTKRCVRTKKNSTPLLADVSPSCASGSV